ncbi:unnamed protein product [Sphagnum balticum]
MESWTLRTLQQQLGWQRYGLEKMANSGQQGPWFWRIQKLRARISNPRSRVLVSSSSSSSSLFSFIHLGMKTRKTRRRRGGRTDCRVLRGGDGVAHAHVNNNKEVVTPVVLDQELQESLANLVKRSAKFSSSPETSLRNGCWVKLICGASFEDLADIRNLSLVYTFAGVDCIDCAADSAVVTAVMEGVSTACSLALELHPAASIVLQRPWIMVSINDDEDPHFRKAEFDSAFCPDDCPRPCERVCPASAIVFDRTMIDHSRVLSTISHQENSIKSSEDHSGGVITERCYGCGRCLPVCPLGLIRARTYVRDLKTVAELLRSNNVDAIEIHTGSGYLRSFEKLVTALAPSLSSLKVIAVSVPDLGESMIPTLTEMHSVLLPSLQSLNLWQLDGRPMSGDVGAGATRASVALASRLVASPDCPPGFLQLAGGTNAHTVHALKKEGLFQSPNKPGRDAAIAGVAYGGYARKIVAKYLEKMEEETVTKESTESITRLGNESTKQLEHYPSLLLGALQEAIALVAGVKEGQHS